MAFRGEQSSGGEDGLEDLTKAIIEDVLRMPGNEVCCDCGAAGAYCSCICNSTRSLPALGLFSTCFVNGQHLHLGIQLWANPLFTATC